MKDLKKELEFSKARVKAALDELDEAQNEHFKLINDDDSKQIKIVATTVEESFTFNCQAPSYAVIAHVGATIKAGFKALEGETNSMEESMAEMHLILEIIKELNIIKKSKTDKKDKDE